MLHLAAKLLPGSVAGSIYRSRLNRLIAWHNYNCSSSSDFSSISWTAFPSLDFFHFFHSPNFSCLALSASLGIVTGQGDVVERGCVLGGFAKISCCTGKLTQKLVVFVVVVLPLS